MSFTAQIDAWVKKSNVRLEYVVKQSTSDLIREAQTPVAKGGNMRVDTGFLRNSGMARIDGLPSGASVNPNPDVRLGDFDFAETSITINRWKIGEVLYFGWVANYARYRENRDGFMRRAAQNWQQHVNKSVNEAKAAIK